MRTVYSQPFWNYRLKPKNAMHKHGDKYEFGEGLPERHTNLVLAERSELFFHVYSTKIGLYQSRWFSFDMYPCGYALHKSAAN